MNMFARDRAASRSLPIFALALIAWLAPATAIRGGETVTIGNLTFVNQALVGVGRLPANLRDKFGETFGSGSAIAVDPKSWVRTPTGYQGTFYMLPDRGFNVTGTSDYRARVNKLFITFTPLDDPAAVPVAQRQNSVAATLTDTILLTDAAGQLLTGLDPDGIRRAANGLPDLPQASNGRVSIDSESLALLPDGGFFIGDEYGPYVYRFSPAGRLLAAIRPPEAFLPKRKGKDHFASNNPGPGGRAPEPPEPETGRANNQGFEGLTLTPPGGKFLVVALQSATRHDGTVPVAPNGKLVDGVVPATLTRYIDINETAQLQKFGLHNGEPNDRNNLSEKWEGMALAPALDPANPNDYFLFVTNDNDFITQNGYQAGTPYKDASGLEVDTMILVYRITLPEQLK